MWGVQDFLAQGGQVAFSIDHDTSVGPAGVYVKTLATGALVRVLDSGLTYSVGFRAALSFSDDGRRVAYNESSGGGLTAKSIPRVVDLATGVRLNAATLTNGTVGNGNVTTGVLLSRDGRSVPWQQRDQPAWRRVAAGRCGAAGLPQAAALRTALQRIGQPQGS